MKRSLKFALLPVLLLGAFLAVHAQMHHLHRHMNPDQVTARMTKKLNLTPEQAAQVKRILADREQRMASLKADSSVAKEQKKSQRAAIMTDTHTKLDAVLNDQQRQQLAQMHHGHHHHEAARAQKS